LFDVKIMIIGYRYLESIEALKRDTQQRGSIWAALANSGRPLSVNEVFELARKKVGGLGIATVYRNLKNLQTQGMIIKVGLPGQAPRWEVIPENHHHHFLCRKCDKIFEINDCPEDLIRMLPSGYTLEEHDILLRGICSECNATKTKRGSKRCL
jgi:Fur family ferric uptake transcriptional regulator